MSTPTSTSTLKMEHVHPKLKEQIKLNNKLFSTDSDRIVGQYKRYDIDSVFDIKQQQSVTATAATTPAAAASLTSPDDNSKSQLLQQQLQKEDLDRYMERAEGLLQDCSAIILSTLSKIHYIGVERDDNNNNNNNNDSKYKKNKRKYKNQPQGGNVNGGGYYNIRQEMIEKFSSDILTVLGQGARELKGLKVESSLPSKDQRHQYLDEEWAQCTRVLLERERQEIQNTGPLMLAEQEALQKEMDKEIEAQIEPFPKEKSFNILLSKFQNEQAKEKEKLAKVLAADPAVVADNANPKGVWKTQMGALDAKHRDQMTKFEDKHNGKMDKITKKNDDIKKKIKEKYATLKENVRNKYDEQNIKNRYQSDLQKLNNTYTSKKNSLNGIPSSTPTSSTLTKNNNNQNNNNNEEQKRIEKQKQKEKEEMEKKLKLEQEEKEKKEQEENQRLEKEKRKEKELEQYLVTLSLESTTPISSETTTTTETSITATATTTTFTKKPSDPFELVEYKIQKVMKAVQEASDAIKDFKAKNNQIVVDKEILDQLTKVDFEANKNLIKQLKKLTKKKTVQEKRIKSLQERKAQLQFIMSRSARPTLPPPVQESYEKLLSDCNLLYPQLVCTDTQRGKQLLPFLQDLLTRTLKPVKVEIYLFGSSLNGLAFKNSDLDIALVTDRPLHSLSNYTFKVSNVLKSNNFKNVLAITRTRVPIIRFNDIFSSLSCDLSINNPLAIFNSKMIYDYMQIDIRVRTIAIIIKQWAKVRGINDASNNTLHSYSFVNMIIHFMQREEVLILPSLQRMANGQYYYIKGRRYGDGRVKEDHMISDKNCKYYNNLGQLREVFGKHNTMTVPELLFAFFQYYALHFDYQNSVISIRSGVILPAKTKTWDDKREYFFMIEDPFDTTFNIARSIRKPHHLAAIVKEFMRAYELLSNNAPLSELVKAPEDNDFKKKKPTK
ncbi:hypothetical protein DFA_01445 [Cavenderia fasciculata]|uniref:PAP-associated domain-containing protein n=1 Tax=Cavenderia fasciculata TaxID=261658 RepID=F4PST1_CACFS|nr:uncharacterized protein DFA_01445 [Cavenderia fasciculata]EGG21559.1 hypothetical protein DFA_01445 [Cavenderia fasciculata]|eukprot:XP_004359409.1 hypothetical protein DFA_01445 [Cavenderia fasciculata]